jgi:hypothetical protein
MGKMVWYYLYGAVAGYCYVKVKNDVRKRIGVDLWPTPGILHRVVRVYINWADQPERIMEEEGD